MKQAICYIYKAKAQTLYILSKGSELGSTANMHLGQPFK